MVRFGMRPASRAARPPSTAARIADAMRTGSFAFDTAVLTSTAAQPSSMASAASEAVPIPASSTTGTGMRAQISSIRCGLEMPRPEPIGEPSGITVAQPDRRVSGRSPDLRCNKAARQNLCRSTPAPRSTFLDVGIEQFAVADHFELDPVGPSASRASSAVSTASLAVWQPAVLGRKWTRPASRSSRLSSSPARLMRRIEAVDHLGAARRHRVEHHLPVGIAGGAEEQPRAELRPAMTSGSDIASDSLHRLSALAHPHDLHVVARAKLRLAASRRAGPPRR